MKKDITSLKELEAEQNKLKMTMEVAHHELIRSMGRSQHKLKDFMLKKIAVPAGAIGLGVVAAKQVFGTESETKQEKQVGNKSLLAQLFPLALNLIQAYFMKEQKGYNSPLELEPSPREDEEYLT